MAKVIAVVDYGMGNLRSVAKAIEYVASESDTLVTSDPEVILSADRVVFPGQGAARDCMKNLNDHNLSEAVSHAFNNKPFLGICMGLQVLFDHSAENSGVNCIGLVSGTVRRFDRNDAQSAEKVPHMGWNQVKQTRAHPLWEGIGDFSRFYFVHSYYVSPADSQWIAASTEYLVPFTSAIARDNVFATQFHPEKSAESGLRLLQNFTRWDPNQ
ncbi:imidazole glycerol phosphate synthase, glutamine amidotransferase subunit [Chromatiales bacterium (ex Bugula neritina AB1)]|nr:imidazole glycerol phosphate synthase, glutamine amidotransferase subunit [Chromatiales bacterium (ex Bugula neritina AB1)]